MFLWFFMPNVGRFVHKDTKNTFSGKRFKERLALILPICFFFTIFFLNFAVESRKRE